MSVQRMINTRRVPVWVRLPVLDKVYAEHSVFLFWFFLRL